MMAAKNDPDLERSRPTVLVVDVGDFSTMDIIDLGALVRLQLIARRFGASIELRNACPDFIELLRLAGFSEVLPCSSGAADASAELAECGRQPEQGEQIGVDEEVDPVDPTV